MEIDSSNIELSPELIDKINDLIGLDRNLLANKESSNELISKLKNKINTLKDNFIANLPYKYTNDETEFLNFCSKIQNLKLKLDTVKKDDLKIKSLINEYQTNIQNSSRNCDAELKPLILKAITIKRQLFYFKSLIKLEHFRSTIESNLEELSSLIEKQKSQSALSNQDLKTKTAFASSASTELNKLNDQIVNSYLDLIEYADKLGETKCDNLKFYLSQLVNYLHDKIKIIFIK